MSTGDTACPDHPVSNVPWKSVKAPGLPGIAEWEVIWEKEHWRTHNRNTHPAKGVARMGLGGPALVANVAEVLADRVVCLEQQVGYSPVNAWCTSSAFLRVPISCELVGCNPICRWQVSIHKNGFSTAIVETLWEKWPRLVLFNADTTCRWSFNATNQLYECTWLYMPSRIKTEVFIQHIIMKHLLHVKQCPRHLGYFMNRVEKIPDIVNLASW